MDRYTVALWLHLDPDARWSAEQVHAAYRRVVKTFHPDCYDRDEMKKLGGVWIRQATQARQKALAWCQYGAPTDQIFA